MNATTTDRAAFSIYKIERDNFTGRLQTRLSFVRLERDVVHHYHAPTGLVDADELDGGSGGTITAPAGSRLGTTEHGETVLILPNGWTFSADDARTAAFAEDRRDSCGLGWKADA